MAWLGQLLLAIWMMLTLFMTLLGLPGNWLLLAAATLYAWGEDFTRLSLEWLALLALLAVVGEVLEALAAAWGARRQQAAAGTMVAAVCGGLAGGLAGSAFGLVLGALAGSFAGAAAAALAMEYWRGGDWRRARQVAWSVVFAKTWGQFAKTALGLVMVLLVLWRLGWGEALR